MKPKKVKRNRAIALAVFVGLGYTKYKIYPLAPVCNTKFQYKSRMKM